MLSIDLDQSFEEQLAHYAYMASVLGEWISSEGMENRLSAIDVLLWWAMMNEPAEA
tara:strand:+ start:336 stop:503 length:168 start_codon:yes stop_codon:yes gene_type:complete